MVPDTRKMLTPMASDHRRIFFQGFVRYSDAFGNHYITGTSPLIPRSMALGLCVATRNTTIAAKKTRARTAPHECELPHVSRSLDAERDRLRAIFLFED
jgi:hypothetical protein